MLQIFQNRFLRGYQFPNSVEQEAFIERVSAARVLSIDKSDGQNPICYVGRNSLTHEAEFVLSFRSDHNEENLNVVFWNDQIIFDSGSMVYFVTADLVLQASLELTSGLIGLHVISDSKLLILGEADLQIVDMNGRILKSESFDRVSGAAIIGDKLVLDTDSGERLIHL